MAPKPDMEDYFTPTVEGVLVPKELFTHPEYAQYFEGRHEELCEHLRHSPLMEEHGKEALGNITDAFIDGEGNLAIKARVYSAAQIGERGRTIRQRLRDGTLKALSIGMDLVGNLKAAAANSQIASQIRVLEASLVKEPRFRGKCPRARLPAETVYKDTRLTDTPPSSVQTPSSSASVATRRNLSSLPPSTTRPT